MTPFAIADWIKGILAGAIMSNLSGLFDSVNEQVGTSPADFEPRVFEMIRGGSNSAILPIADVFLNLVACYELVQVVTEHNNLASFEPALLAKTQVSESRIFLSIIVFPFKTWSRYIWVSGNWHRMLEPNRKLSCEFVKGENTPSEFHAGFLAGIKQKQQ